MRRQDFPLLSAWLAQPHVQSWWREEHDIAAIEARYGPSVDGVDPTECFVVDRNGEPVGFIQRYLFADNPEWQRALSVTGTPSNAAGIDYLIGDPADRGRGLGPAIIRAFVADVVFGRHREWTQAAATPLVANIASWRALEKAGFRFVGVVPEKDGPGRLMVADRGSDEFRGA